MAETSLATESLNSLLDQSCNWPTEEDPARVQALQTLEHLPGGLKSALSLAVQQGLIAPQSTITTAAPQDIYNATRIQCLTTLSKLTCGIEPAILLRLSEDNIHIVPPDHQLEPHKETPPAIKEIQQNVKQAAATDTIKELLPLLSDESLDAIPNQYLPKNQFATLPPNLNTHIFNIYQISNIQLLTIATEEGIQITLQLPRSAFAAKDQTIHLKDGEICHIGRCHVKNKLLIPHIQASKEHATLFYKDGKLLIQDHSSNGTLYQGSK